MDEWQCRYIYNGWLNVVLRMDDIYSISRIFEQTPKQQVSCDDKEGHYIVTPDDIIYKRCRPLPPCFPIRLDNLIRL